MRCTKSESSDKTGPHVGTRWHVFAGGFLALAVMTLLAAAGGRVIPLFLKQELRTVFMAALLVLFGLKMLYDAMIYEENNEEPEELKEVSRPEHGAALVGPSRLLRAARYFFSPIFIQAASLTLMAEWGDRSQLATFALAADRSASAVCLGAILGHGLCTGLAVLGGNVLAKRISERLVLLIGGICFLSFALFTVVDELFSSGGGMAVLNPAFLICFFTSVLVNGHDHQSIRRKFKIMKENELRLLGEPQVKVEILWVGNAAESDGVVECQHGAEECQLNTLSACGLKKLQGEPESRLSFIEWKSVGRFSRRFEYDYVPWVIVNGRHMPSSEANLTIALCEEYATHTTPVLQVVAIPLVPSSAHYLMEYTTLLLILRLGSNRPHICSTLSKVGAASFLDEGQRCYREQQRDHGENE
ncbi:putative transmembrane protein [Cyclospora cayetanensis]|uniref:Transmembrane protein n=1 Tax=Cyclospora cayetanensis TaxID=88456 RepID=A0A1D3D1B6_9EIME|nr:putative transmembrane protein [Cyclospora cayetanensis]